MLYVFSIEQKIHNSVEKMNKTLTSLYYLLSRLSPLTYLTTLIF